MNEGTRSIKKMSNFNLKNKHLNSSHKNEFKNTNSGFLLRDPADEQKKSEETSANCIRKVFYQDTFMTPTNKTLSSWTQPVIEKEASLVKQESPRSALGCGTARLPKAISGKQFAKRRLNELKKFARGAHRRPHFIFPWDDLPSVKTPEFSNLTEKMITLDLILFNEKKFSKTFISRQMKFSENLLLKVHESSPQFHSQLNYDKFVELASIQSFAGNNMPSSPQIEKEPFTALSTEHQLQNTAPTESAVFKSSNHLPKGLSDPRMLQLHQPITHSKLRQ